MDRLLALDDNIENRVEPGRARYRSAEIPFGDDDRPRVTFPVEHAWHEPLRAQAPRTTRAELIPLAHLQFRPFSGHGGRL
jgi:hypothetical protein